MTKPKKAQDKPTLMLLSRRKLTFENLLAMFRQLAGREPTPEEIDEARQKWEAFERNAGENDREQDGGIVHRE